MPADNIFDDIGPQDLLMRIAWLDFLLFAIGHDQIVDQYFAVTGDKYTFPKNGIEQLIDKATGNDVEFLRRFVTWVTVNIWDGEPDEC